MKFTTTLSILALANAALGLVYDRAPPHAHIKSSTTTSKKVTSSTSVKGTTTSTSSKKSSVSNPWGQGSGTSIAWGKDLPGWDAGPSVLASSVPKSYGHFTGLPKTLTATTTSTIAPGQSGNSTSTKSTTAISTSPTPGCINSPTSRSCWYNGFNINTDYETSWPNTGKVVKYSLEVTNTTLSPEGTPKQMLVVNGQYPGPLIEANWGDTLELTVKNSLTCNGTSMHWHGFRQLNSNPQDGVNGITECPIAPGDSKTYTFQATQFGTTWYHSHFSAQYGDGVAGPVVIHGPASANYDIELPPITFSETYGMTAFQADYYAERNGPPTAVNYLINGQNIKVDGSAGSRAQFTFTPGKKHLLRLINTGVDTSFKVTLDGHSMTVISTDFVPITPYVTTALNLNIGQRYEVVIEANQAVSSYWLRGIPQQACSFNDNNGLGNANGIISYTGANSSLPTSVVANYTDSCQDEPAASLVPVVSKAVDSTGFAAQASALPVNIGIETTSAGNLFSWTLNGIAQDIDWANPTIAQVVSGNDTFPSIKDVITLNQSDVWTFWIIQNQFFVPHPIHLHGHDFSILGQGAGTFDVTANFGDLNFVNPPRRDVAYLLASGWTVIAFKTDNPGAWLMHCHIAWHVGEGLSLQFLELPDQVASQFNATVRGSAFQNTCENWVDFTNSAAYIYNKTDSGLKRRDNGFSEVTRHLHSHKHRSLRPARRASDFHSY